MKAILFGISGIVAVVGLTGCASTVTEGPRRDPGPSQNTSSSRGAPEKAYAYRTLVETPAPVAIPQKPGTTTEPNYLRHTAPDQPLYIRGQ